MQTQTTKRCHFIKCPSLSEVKVAQLCPTLCDPMDYTVHGILQARILEWVAFPFSKGSSQLGIKPRSLVLQVNSLSAEPQEKPKNTGVGSLCLLQQIFPTQELNQNQTMVPYIAGGFFTNWAFREALVIYIIKIKFLNLAVIHFLVLNGLTGPFVALFSSDLFTSQKVYSQCP